MEEIFSRASELGSLIKETEVYIKFEQLNKQVDDDKEASLLLKKYNEIAETIQQKQDAGFSLEKFEQERFKDISMAVASNELLMRYLKARELYIEMLMKIHDTLSSNNL